MNIGDKMYFKGKCDLYNEVVIKSVAGEYATVKGDIMFGTKKVRIDKLFKEPSEGFKKFAEKTQRQMEQAENILYKAKNNKY
jgi:hypothetical protein